MCLKLEKVYYQSTGNTCSHFVKMVICNQSTGNSDFTIEWLLLVPVYDKSDFTKKKKKKAITCRLVIAN